MIILNWVVQIYWTTSKLGISSIFNEKTANCDIAIFLRDFSSPIQDAIQYQRANGARIAIDLCVNPFDVTGVIKNGYGMTRETSVDTLAAIKQSDGILCASSFIADRAKQFSSLVAHLPDSVNTKHYRFRKSRADVDSKPLRAIWAGVQSKVHHLEGIIPELEKQNMRLEIISDKSPSLSNSFHFTKWSYKSSPRSLLKGDIAISPRQITNQYDLGHSHFKIAVFMAQGVPAIASPLPSYEELIDQTKGGIIVRNLADWRIALSQIRHDRTLLQKLGDAAYTGMQQFSTEVIAGQYVKFFRTLIAHRSV